MTQKEIADKRAKNLCFYCDEKFVPGHKCSGQLFLLQICADKNALEEYKLEALLDKPVISKCNFAAKQVEYLGHIISGEGVSIDPSKIIAMQKWPTPVTLKQLRSFLGLTGYYRRFIKDYVSINKPLTSLLKNNSFAWNSSAHASFEALKVAMSQDPVLALPDFNKPFIMETHASKMGIGAVLQQGGHPIAYLSFFKVMKVQLNLSTTYHPQTDGQTEVVNKCVECFLRCMNGESLKVRVKWVSLDEYWYNTNYHSSTHTTPFEIVYRQPPNLHLLYIAGTSSLEEVGVLPLCGPNMVLSVEPEAIIGKRFGKLNNKVVLYVLVKWVNQTEEEATRELYTDLLQRYGISFLRTRMLRGMYCNMSNALHVIHTWPKSNNPVNIPN
nr:retrovirus-related Pol polyprotein from transposon 297 family [Tanacetum cinerariifolium]